MRIRHILVPTDFSDSSREAFETAIEMARDTGARLTLFHVHHVPTTIFPDVILPITPELVHDIEHSVDQMLQHLTERARKAGVTADWQTTFGTTHVEICLLAETSDVDLIVIGTHGRSGFSHAILGSVAEKVVRKAPCPVLTVRPRMHATFAQHSQ
jgi:nucleotide-binding universal stress UspA family protein